MIDRFRACSSLGALAIVSIGALSACEQSKPEEPVTKVSSALTTLQTGDVAVTCLNSATDALQIVTLVPLDVGVDLKFSDREWTGTAFNGGETGDFQILASLDAATLSFAAGAEIPFNPGGINGGPEQVFIY